MRKKKSHNDFEDAVLMNSDTYFDYLERLKRIAMTMFEWTDLPDGMDSRYIERCLYYQGSAGLLYDEDYGFINTKATSAGKLNIYGLPTSINCYSYGYSKTRNVYYGGKSQDLDYDRPDTPKNTEAILVLNNWERIPTCSTIELFAYRLAQAQRTVDVNITAQRTPILILVDENQRLTMKNIYQQYDGNTPVIFGDKNQLTADTIKSIKTDAPYIIDKIMKYKAEIWGEALTFLGINNNPIEKNERLLVGEVNSNNEVINMNLQSWLAPRKKAVEQFNEKFGANIDVKVRSDIFNIVKREESTMSEFIPDINMQATDNEMAMGSGS